MTFVKRAAWSLADNLEGSTVTSVSQRWKAHIRNDHMLSTPRNTPPGLRTL